MPFGSVKIRHLLALGSVLSLASVAGSGCKSDEDEATKICFEDCSADSECVSGQKCLTLSSSPNKKVCLPEGCAACPNSTATCYDTNDAANRKSTCAFKGCK